MTKFFRTFETLPKSFYSKSQIDTSYDLKLIHFNQELGNFLDIKPEEFQLTDRPEYMSLSMAYAGHQFGNFVASLGDGRAMLLAEVMSPIDNQIYDLHLKGSGRTTYSRRGDGKSALGPVIREFLISESMKSFGVPTTRSLAIYSTGEMVEREGGPVPGGLLCRVARSDIRIGTFEYFAARGETQSVKLLADYCIERYYPELLAVNPNERYFEFWKSVVRKQLKLIAQWMSLGFIHGVMNTDNMNISGESIDYGPCAFMDEFKSSQVLSFIDKQGRYAYNQQPKIAKWNLLQLTYCFIPLFSDVTKVAISKAEAEIDTWDNAFFSEYKKIMLNKFGFESANETQESLIPLWLGYLEKENLDYTLSFKYLEKFLTGEPITFFKESEFFKKFIELWSSQNRSLALMQKNNPYFIPRNHLVEKAINDVYQNQDWDTFNLVYELSQKPYELIKDTMEYYQPPKDHERVKNTFCGT